MIFADLREKLFAKKRKGLSLMTGPFNYNFSVMVIE